jgi:2-hydroxy-3-keto-5-methylthiopentenyl-1-phosphate phosphatase
MNETKDFLVLVDFDGTVTQNDVGALLFDTYAPKHHRQIVSLWLDRKISSKECMERLCRLVKISEFDLKKFVISQKIDDKFPDFVDLCKCRSIKLVILSDGLDYYIRLILGKFGLEELPFFSNVLKFENTRLIPEFPYFDLGCGNCGNCKKNHLISLRSKGQKVIYIGDGLSDRCAVTEADIVFAKKDLRKFCQKEGIRHYPFKDFGDISRGLQKLLDDQRKVT